MTSPQCHSKLRQEIHDCGVWDRRITFKESQELPYLQAVLKQALRMHPATGPPLWRVLPEGGLHLAERWLPPGTNVGLNSWVAHYDNRVFGDDADVFRPERWEEAKEEGGERYKQMEASCMSFGLGSRTCFARHISILEMSKLIPEIVKRFNYTLGTQKGQWRTVNCWLLKPEKFPVTVQRLVDAHL